MTEPTVPPVSLDDPKVRDAVDAELVAMTNDFISALLSPNSGGKETIVASLASAAHVRHAAASEADRPVLAALQPVVVEVVRQGLVADAGGMLTFVRPTQWAAASGGGPSAAELDRVATQLEHVFQPGPPAGFDAEFAPPPPDFSAPPPPDFSAPPPPDFSAPSAPDAPTNPGGGIVFTFDPNASDD